MKTPAAIKLSSNKDRTEEVNKYFKSIQDEIPKNLEKYLSCPIFVSCDDSFAFHYCKDAIEYWLNSWGWTLGNPTNHTDGILYVITEK